MNETTRKFPRTMEEAFGPYEGRPLEEADAPMDWQDALVMWASFAALTLAVIFVFAPEYAVQALLELVGVV